jgi:DNA primase
LYHKSQMLFGYSELYQEIRKKKEVVVVEGEFDVISSAQAHVNNVVAIKGSALTSEHVKLLGRVADRVLLSLDQDSAGVEATKRAITVAKDTTVELRVVNLRGVLAKLKTDQPDVDITKLDPDDLARKHPGLWREAIKTSVSVYEFFLQATLAQFDPESPEGKRQIMTEMAPVLGSIPLSVEQDVYVKKVAQALQVKEELVRTDIDRVGRRQSRGIGRGRTAGSALPEKSAEPKPEQLHLKTRRQKVEEFVLFLLFQSSPAQLLKHADSLSDITWATLGAQQLMARLLEMPEPFNMEKFAQLLPEDLQQLLTNVSLNPEYDELLKTLDFEKEWQQAVKELRQEVVRERLQAVEDELNKLDVAKIDQATKDQRQKELLQEIVSLQKKVS